MGAQETWQCIHDLLDAFVACKGRPLSLFEVTSGLGRFQAAQFFFQTQVMLSAGFIEAKQDDPFGDMMLMCGPETRKLMGPEDRLQLPVAPSTAAGMILIAVQSRRMTMINGCVDQANVGNASQPHLAPPGAAAYHHHPRERRTTPRHPDHSNDTCRLADFAPPPSDE